MGQCGDRSPATTMGGVPGGLGEVVVADVVDVVEFEMNGPDPLGLGPAHASAVAPITIWSAKQPAANSLRIMITFRSGCPTLGAACT
jgi:hypothetical protein